MASICSETRFIVKYIYIYKKIKSNRFSDQIVINNSFINYISDNPVKGYKYSIILTNFTTHRYFQSAYQLIDTSFSCRKRPNNNLQYLKKALTETKSLNEMSY